MVIMKVFGSTTAIYSRVFIFKSGIFKIRTEDEEIYCFKEGGVTADTRESI